MRIQEQTPPRLVGREELYYDLKASKHPKQLIISEKRPINET